MTFASVIVNHKARAVDRLFDYAVPDSLADSVCCGNIVSVPFGKSVLQGIVVELKETSEVDDPKELLSLISPRPVFSDELLCLAHYIADRYLCSKVAALNAMLPFNLALGGRLNKQNLVKCCYLADIDGLKLTPKQQALTDMLKQEDGMEQGLLKQAGFSADLLKRAAAKDIIAIKEERRSVGLPYLPAAVPAALSEAQQTALDQIEAERQNSRRPFLLMGVTGSGKTEIYLRLIQKVTDEGKQAIVLVPEICLSSQMVDFVRRRLSGPVAVLHSGMTAKERRDIWENIAAGHYPVVVGARSAVFAPLPSLGLIVMDEEQDSSYKQDSQPRFHTREVAQKRVQLCCAQLVLGSATPSLESYQRATTGEYAFARLDKRYYAAPLPQVAVCDMRQELRDGNSSLFSRLLQQQMAACLARGEQTLLLINRRGFYSFYSCRSCGTVIECPHCSIPMAYHKEEDKLKCHYCGRMLPPPDCCPVCGSEAIGHFGAGTQRVATEAARLFPQAKVARLDYDISSQRGEGERVYRSVLAGEVDILVGTQMIAKGHDFPSVTLAAVVAADITLNLPDLRSGERSFQLLTQLSGRAGRRQRQGMAVIQTYNPDNYAIRAAAAQDYELFYRQEVKQRQLHNYPPFCQMARLLFAAPKRQDAELASEAWASMLRHLLADGGEVCGPAYAPWQKIKDLYRCQLLVKCPDDALLHQAILQAQSVIEGEKRSFKNVQVKIDVDPYSFM